ncbi:MAG TPA: hypothetical protein VNP98_02290 [Chthoniobacterales bacterium]|nr:hypothetical protein [Chthoniobacterales bacterium]
MTAKNTRFIQRTIVRGLLLGFSVTFLGLALHAEEDERSPAQMIAEATNPVFRTTVEWYKPPPESFDLSRGVRLPYQLFDAVPVALIEEATALLGDEDVIPLTTQQVTRFSSAVDPDAVLDTKIEEAKKKLLFFQENPVDLTLLKQYGMSGEEQEERRRRMMEDLATEIKCLQEWERQLKPYLVKAVALQAGGYFSGVFVSQDLVIGFGAMGSHPVPMERRAVVAFLPKKPRHVYTGVGMME